MTLAISGTTGITLATQFDSASTFGFKNRIINGAMVIDQRNAGAIVTVNTVAAFYANDRFRLSGVASAGVFTGQQSTTAPANFVNSLKITTTTSATPASSDSYYIVQPIEGYNIADLGWGTANAKTVTLSFQVYSSLTGTFGGSMSNSAVNRSYPFTYSISVANTWTTISVTIAGDTSGTWLTDNGVGIRVYFGLGVGSTLSGTAGAWAGAQYISATSATSVISTSGATFYITGVQLEKGSTATTFDYRPYGTELALCQRYYYRTNGTANLPRLAAGFSVSTTVADFVFSLPVTMRTIPSALEQSGTATDYNLVYGGTNANCSSVPTIGTSNVGTVAFSYTVAAVMTLGQGVIARQNTNGYLGWSAEL